MILRIRESVTSTVYSAAALLACIAAGYLVAAVTGPERTVRMLPWLLGRSLGLAAYASLTALMIVGVWLRHPWRLRWPIIHPEVRLRVHAALGATTVLLVAGHLSALALDHYAGVGWRGAFIPGVSHYRTIRSRSGLSPSRRCSPSP